MKPLMLQGHERSITQIKFNEEGDLLFSASKDNRPNVWFSMNGELLGSYDGHQGTIWSIDVSFDSSTFCTGAGDQTLRLWDTATGATLNTLETKASVRGVEFSYGGALIAYTTDQMMKQESKVTIIDVRDPQSMDGTSPVMTAQVTPSHAKALSILWGNLDQTLMTGHDDGSLIKWDVKSGTVIDKITPHSKQITDLQRSPDGSLIITSSKDNTAKLYDVENFTLMKTYKTDRPVNSAAISPLMDSNPHVLLGGGQEAMDVTTTSAKVAKFEARLFHLVFEEEFARVRGHFGPINSLAFHPNGRGYASGAEDGFIRVHVFDESYYQYEFDY